MKIVFVTPRYYPEHGGVSYVVSSIASRLARSGFNVKVVSFSSKLERAYYRIGEVVITRFKSISPSEAYHVPYPDFIYRLKSEVKGCDIIHLHSIHSLTTPISMLLAKGNWKSGIVLNPHFLSVPSTGVRKALFKPYSMLLSILLRKYCGAIVAASRYEAHSFSRVFNYDYKSIVIIPHGVDEDTRVYKWRGFTSDHVTICFPGRIDLTQKRQDVAIMALKKMILDGFNVKLKIIGDGPHRNLLLELIDRLRVKEHVEFLRWLDRRSYLREIASSTLVLQLSNYENFNIVSREALSIGTPVFVSLNTALLDLYMEYLHTGLIRGCYSLNHIEVACKLEEFISELKSIKRGFRVRLESWDSILKKYIKLYESLVR